MNMGLFAAIPEIFVVIMIMVILMVDAFISEKRASIATGLTLLTLFGGFILQILVYNPEQPLLAFNNMFVLDPLAHGMKLLTYLASIVIVLYVKRYLIDNRLSRGVFYSIFLFAILGMLVMISANNMLILYVGLELLSLALYGLVALNNDHVKASEAAMKFFILGSLASGILLYGISFIYGASGGHLQLNNVLNAIYTSHANSPIFVFGLVFIVAGLAFKLGLVPFHMWIPDVYDGASLAVTTIIGTVTKLAAIVFVLRFLISGFAVLSHQWALMFSVLAFLSIFLGNIAAIAQTNIKRMLGYSTIAHMGFVAFGLACASTDGIVSLLFYIITYVITALAGFGVLLFLSRDGFECENIDDLRGLNKLHPVYAGIMLLVMFSLAGIPPFVGFYAKFKILEALIAVGYLKSAVFAVIMSLIGAFYYLRVVKVMYFDEPKLEITPATVGVISRSVLTINGLLLLVLGILPGGLLLFCQHLIQ